MFHFALFLIFLYVVWRLVLPLPYAWWIKALLSCFLLFISKYHFIQLWLFGSMFSPELPTWAVLILGGLFAGFAVIALLTFISDVVFLLLRLFRQPVAWGTGWRLGVMVVSVVLTVIGVHQAVRVPDVHRVEIPLRSLPAQLNGLKIVQLTDLHISHLFKRDWLQQVVDKTNALNPDVIVITGDLIDGLVQDRWQDIGAYAQLKAKYGVFAITGNHEYYFGASQWVQAFEKLGMRVLQNEHVVLQHQGEPFVLAGVNDEAAVKFGLAGPDINKALAGAPKVTTILLDHRPKQVHENIAKGVDLQLSGHAHGGMIIGLDQLVKLFNQGFVSGLYSVDGAWMYLSNGTGLWNGFPIRLGVPSEITLLELTGLPNRN